MNCSSNYLTRMPMRTFQIVCPILLMCASVKGQTLTLEQAVQLALEKNPATLAASAETARQSALKRAFDIPKAEVSLMSGQFNSINRDQNITISQTIPFPTALISQGKLAKSRAEEARLAEMLTRTEIAYRVKQLFNQCIYLQVRRGMLLRQDSLFAEMLRVATVQYTTGESTLLAKTSAETQRIDMANQLRRNEADIENVKNSIRLWCQTEFVHAEGALENLIADQDTSLPPLLTPAQLLMEQRLKTAEQEKKVSISQTLPDIKVGYFNQTLIGVQTINGQEVYFDSNRRFDGFQIGLTFPLWVMSPAARIRSGNHAEEVAKQEAQASNVEIMLSFNGASMELEKNRKSLSYYQKSALANAMMLRSQSEASFRSGEIDYETLLRNLRQVIVIEDGYLSTLYEYNNNLITLDYLRGIN
jgi:heavy metal efflux system protein